MTHALLEVEDLRKSFGGIVAVDGVTFDVEEGSITGLIGPNGAGKTTTFNLVSGFYRPDGGRIRLKGTDIRSLMRPDRKEQEIWTGSSCVLFGGIAGIGAVGGGLSTTAAIGATAAGAVVGAGIYQIQERLRLRYPEYQGTRPHQLARAGLARTFQITRELQGMTVLENMMLAPMGQAGEHLLTALLRRRRTMADEDALRADAMEMLEFLELDHLAGELAGNLSGGQRKLLELGRVLMTDPDLVLLDEPVAGVNPTLTRSLLERLQLLRDEGRTFLVVEHDMEVIMNISDTVIVMSEGRKLMEGPPESVQRDQRVIDAYLGG